MSEVIDVRTLHPRERHPLIFERLDGLAAGDSLRLLNDHDPKPLRYQLEAERPGWYTWEVVEDGPEQWAIDIVNRTHVLDARPILAAGDEPFDAIMDAAQKVQSGEVLVVLAPFEPVPLEGVLSEQGFTFSADEIAPGDWRVSFLKS
ncbi:MAG: DUF2249 domain-containing protein [Acidimicrobiia bacterium]|nr:DUF2249 domain-containing protein [Acidimicrobiia bacterium]